MSCIYRAENCKNYFKIVGKIIFKKEKKMTWQLMWRNMKAATLNAMLQLLVILAANPRVARDNYFYGGFIIIIFFFLQFKLI